MMPTMDKKGVFSTEDKGLQALLHRCMHSTKHFAQTFMAESFSGTMSWQHERVWELIDDESAPKTCVCAWRGFGKTTTQVAKIVKSILFRDHRFVLFIGKSHDYAATITESVKMELCTNKRITDVFGSMKARSYEDVDLSFSKKSWFACDPKSGAPVCFITPKGAKQQVRGANIRIGDRLERPTYVGIDDLEDDEEVNNEEMRASVRKWFSGSLMPCVDSMDRPQPDPETRRWRLPPPPAVFHPPWRVFYQDTLKHEDSLIAHLLSQSDWECARLPQSELRGDAKHRQYYSLVPEILSDAEVRAQVASAREDGTLDCYAREKMCLPMLPEDASWTKELIKYYSESVVGASIQKSDEIDRFIVVDPAKTATQRSAYTAILGVAADVVTGTIYLRDLVNKRLEPEEILDETFKMALRLNARIIAVEVTGLDLHIQHLYQNEASMRGLGVNFVWLKGSSLPAGDFGTGREAAKRARASMILPYYRKGLVSHENRLKDSALEAQMFSYPKCTYWDALDCAGYVPQVLAIGGRYFQPRVVEGQTLEDFESSSNYVEIGEELALGNWRTG